MIQPIRDYFVNLHDVECNQRYGKNKSLPYSFHLDAAYSQLELFKYYMPDDIPTRVAIYIGVYGHDSIEDARLTYNDIVDLPHTHPSIFSRTGTLSNKTVSQMAADIIFCCTEMRGKDRRERHSDEYFTILISNKWAVFVKLCDLIANIKYSLLTNSSMLKTYKNEWSNVIFWLSRGKHLDEFPDMVAYIGKLLEIN